MLFILTEKGRSQFCPMNLWMVSHIIPRRSLKQESSIFLLSISLSKQDQQWKTQRVTTRGIKKIKKKKEKEKEKDTGERHMVVLSVAILFYQALYCYSMDWGIK